MERTPSDLATPTVLKFGGTSVEDAAACARVAGIVRAHGGSRPVVVVSALAGVTDALLGCVREGALRAFDTHLERHREIAQRLLGPEARGAFLGELERARGELAALVEAALGAGEMQIWTDVSGVQTADPRVVRGARTIPSLSYAEAAELAYFGAKVLHPKTIQPAKERGIPVRICNSRAPDDAGTLVSGAADVWPGTVKSIAHKSGITVVQISSASMLGAYGFLRALFEVFDRHELPVDVVATSEVSVTLTVDDASILPAVMAWLEALGAVQAAPHRHPLRLRRGGGSGPVPRVPPRAAGLSRGAAGGATGTPRTRGHDRRAAQARVLDPPRHGAAALRLGRGRRVRVRPRRLRREGHPRRAAGGSGAAARRGAERPRPALRGGRRAGQRGGAGGERPSRRPLVPLAHRRRADRKQARRGRQGLAG